MTVSIDATSRKYHGAMSANYETKRKKQQRWDIENDIVASMLKKLKPKSVLDVPVGTGRFIPVYARIGVKNALGVDISDSMLDQAIKKAKQAAKYPILIRLKCKDVRKLKVDPVDVSVCVRFLDLIDDKAMREVVTKLCKVSRRAIICTIRLGPTYVPKSNTATHDEKQFRAHLKKHGWKIVKSVPIFTQGWFVFLLKPRS